MDHRDTTSALLKSWIMVGGMSLVLLAGCRTTAAPERSSDSESGVESVTYAEKRLMDIVERQRRLMETWSRDPETQSRDSLEMRAATLAREYESYLASNPDDHTARLLYGKFLVKLGQSETAIRQFLEVDRRDPTLPVVKQQIGNYLAETGRYMAALPYFINARDLDPEEAIYPYQLGTLLYEYRQQFLDDGFYTRETLDVEMQAAFAEAARLEPSHYPYQLRYGESFYDVRNPDWERALQQWNHTLNLAPTDFDRQVILLHKSRVLTNLERYSKATALAEQVVDTKLAYTRDQLIETIEAKSAESDFHE